MIKRKRWREETVGGGGGELKHTHHIVSRVLQLEASFFFGSRERFCSLIEKRKEIAMIFAQPLFLLTPEKK